MAELLAACKCATPTPCELRWASEELSFTENKVSRRSGGVWLPARGARLREERARAQAGLRSRPVADTIHDTLPRWAEPSAGNRPFERTGIAPAEGRLLAN